MLPMGKYVFVIDDDPALLRLATIILRMDGHNVEAFRSAELALDLLGNGSLEPDVIVLDPTRPGITARTCYLAAREAGYSKPALIVSAYAAEAARQSLGADAALPKPVMPDDLSEVVKRVLV